MVNIYTVVLTGKSKWHLFLTGIVAVRVIYPSLRVFECTYSDRLTHTISQYCNLPTNYVICIKFHSYDGKTQEVSPSVLLVSNSTSRSVEVA
jgi:hypothetical protein